MTPINLQRIVTPADHREREALATMKERTRDLTFTVQWSAGRQAFIVRDENGYVLASSDQRDTALATAKRDVGKPCGREGNGDFQGPRRKAKDRMRLLMPRPFRKP